MKVFVNKITNSGNPVDNKLFINYFFLVNTNYLSTKKTNYLSTTHCTLINIYSQETRRVDYWNATN